MTAATDRPYLPTVVPALVGAVVLLLLLPASPDDMQALDPTAEAAAAGLALQPPSSEFSDFDAGKDASDIAERESRDQIDRQEADETPDPAKLIAKIRDVITDSSDYYQRCAAAHDWRNCLWEGQDDSGRKRAENLGRKPAPWEGASDSRIRVIDEIINEHVARYKAAFFAGDMQAQSHSVSSMADGQAANASTLMRYVLRTQMQPEISDEIEFLGQWQETFGLSIARISWDRQQRMEPVTVTLDQFVDAAVQAAVQGAAAQQEQAGGGADLPEAEAQAIAAESIEETIELFKDPDNEQTIIDEVLVWAPHLTTRQARNIATEIRETGTSTYPQPREAINRPEWIAKRPMMDIWFPRETENIKRAPWIAETEWLTLDELRDRVASDGWDEDFVKEVQQHRGELFDDTIEGVASLYSRGLISSLDSDFGISRDRSTEDFADLFQIVRMYYRAVDKKGFPAIHEVVMHPEVKETFGKFGLLEGAHGEMPYVAFRRERKQRALIDSRGVPELAFSQQLEIKAQRDSRTDRTELATSPPLKVPRRRGGGRYDLRPGTMLPQSRTETLEFLDPPKHDLGTIEIEQSTMDDLDRYFGRIGTNTADPVTAQLKQQDAVNNFLNSLTASSRLTWQMMQQWMSPTAVARIVGGQQAVTNYTREDIQGAFDFSIAFDVRDLDNEFLISKIKAIGELVIPLDVEGRLDRAELAGLALRAIDPQIGAQIIKDPQQAAADEAADEQQALAMMSAGVEPQMKEGGNHQLRLEVLTQGVQSNPALLARAQGQGTDPEGGGSGDLFPEMLQARVQHHQFQLQQRENANTGRVGAERVTG